MTSNLMFSSSSSNNHALHSSVNNKCGTSSTRNKHSPSIDLFRCSPNRTNIRIRSSTAGTINGATQANTLLPRELRLRIVESLPRTSRSVVMATSICMMLCDVNTVKVVATMFTSGTTAACHRDLPTANRVGHNAELRSRHSIDQTFTI